jgi:SAM-dependent methyltransferase
MNYTDHDHRMHAYYQKRAPFYDIGFDFDHPQRGPILREIAGEVSAFARGRRVLEVAAGTGVWTRVAAEVAAHLTATDVTTDTLAIAKEKTRHLRRLEFIIADAYRLRTVDGAYDAGLAMQWFSHVPRKRFGEFFDSFHGRLGSGAVVFMADNQPHRDQLKTDLIREGLEPDTYQDRSLPDGSVYRIIKNYFSTQEIEGIFGSFADCTIRTNEQWWWVTYTIP